MRRNDQPLVLEGAEIEYIDQLESSRPMRMFHRIGSRVPAHASGAGKALLAHQPEATVAALMGSGPLRALTPRTIRAVDELRSELARVRARGFAVEAGEYYEGVICIAVPTFDRSGQARATVSISGPSDRLGERDHGDIGSRMCSWHAAR